MEDGRRVRAGEFHSSSGCPIKDDPLRPRPSATSPYHPPASPGLVTNFRASTQDPLLPFLASPRPYHLPLTAALTDAWEKAVPCTAIHISSLTIDATRMPDSRIAVTGQGQGEADRGTNYSRPNPALINISPKIVGEDD
jgi:hypothetical protein